MTTRTNTVEFAGETITLERPSGRKTSRALALLRAVSAAMPELSSDIARFRTKYEEENVIRISRAEARLRYPPDALIDTATGEPALDEHGQVRWLPSPLDGMSEADWERSGHTIPLRKAPTPVEVAVAVFDQALELAQDNVYSLLALFTLSNEDVKAAHKSSPEALTDLIEARVDHLLDDGYGDEWMPLAVAVGELIDTHFVQNAKALGDRLGNVLRLVGIDPTSLTDDPSSSPSDSTPSSDGPTSSTRPSSTDTADGSDTDPTTSSTSDGPSSSSSAGSPTAPTTKNGHDEPATNSAAAKMAAA